MIKIDYLNTFSPFFPYSYVVIIPPQINAISSSVGSFRGQQLTITGINFNTAGPNVVTVAGQPCAIQSITNTKIACTVQAVANPETDKLGKMPFKSDSSTQANGFLGQAGIKIARFATSKDSNWLESFVESYDKGLLTSAN